MDRTPTTWARVRALLDTVLALPPAERQAHLHAADVPDALRAEVQSLLAHMTDEAALPAGSAPRFLAAPAAGSLHDTAPAPARTGQVLGAWRIVGELGSGGMGEVWLAERADGAYEARTAIKVLKRGMDSSAVLRRFAQEQRALARLDHPHIARLLDAGRTDDSLPYFVMEHVPGQRIDAACSGLPVERRLALFLQLADAVAHAHRNLLVHRDLKPSNVLVDEAGRVKLLDFGIAKALDPTEGDDADVTAAGQRPFTPSFASPEQVRGDPVSTATDVYSLGVLLYLLLTGVRPYGHGPTPPGEMARCVLEDRPARPSSLPDDAVADPQWPLRRRALRGDLDNIMLKALDKRIEGRYASVDALAADLRAHLDGYPVSARPAGAGYLMSRFVRRHRASVAAAGVALLAVLGGAGAALWQAHVADAQRDLAQARFKQVRQLANQLVFKYHDQIEFLPGATKAREAMLVDAAGFLDGLDSASSDDPQLAFELASTYRIARLQGVDGAVNTGQHAAAEVNLDKALALTRRYVDRADMSAESIGVAINMHVSRAELWQRRGQMARADATLRAAVPMLERSLARFPKDTRTLTSAISLHGVLARIQGNNLGIAALGHWRAACDSADRSRAAAEAMVAADPVNVYGPDSLAYSLGEQAQCRWSAGRFDEAAALFERQLELREQMARKFPDDMDFRYQRAVIRGNLARVRSHQGRHDEARAVLDLATRLGEEAMRSDPGNQAARHRMNVLALARVPLHLAAGDGEAARQAADALLQRVPRQLGASFVETGWQAECLLWAARAWRAIDPQRALTLAREAQGLVRARGSDDDNATRRWLHAQALGEQALALAQAGEPSTAATTARAALIDWDAGRGPDGPPPLLAVWIEPLRALAATSS